MQDTIYALSSGQPPAGIGVIRISGCQAKAALLGITSTLPPPREARIRLLRAVSDGRPLDRALVLWMPGPATATGEDMVELHCHGGRAVVNAVQAELGEVAGLRVAEAGEFTRRAFENGRIDFNEAEGLADLLQAETEAQRRSAMAMAEGHFSRKIQRWQDVLLDLAAQVEAALDFADEDDVPDEAIDARIRAGVADLAGQIGDELERPSAERLRDGIKVVIAGPPNAGKSTLLNTLVGRDAAIVSDIAGTTRDRIEVPVSFSGIPFLITDTAGLRDDHVDSVEAVGIGLARSAIEQADILLWLGDREAVPEGALWVRAKADLNVHAEGDLAVSAVTGEGIPRLVEFLIERSRTLMPQQGEYALHRRQRETLAEIASALGRARESQDLLIVAEELRMARNWADRLTGRADTEAMLDRLFGSFCIGK